MTQEKRPVVVLLGMHRSGTSLTMSVLSSLGIRCGESLISAGRGNEAGYWEHAGIVAAHEHLLADLNRVWHGPTGSYPMPDGWLESDPAKRVKQRLVAIVEREIANTGEGLWGFKDPRTCRLLPLWDEIFEEANAKPFYLLAVRPPAAVCASLAKKNGMDRPRSELTWLQYNLEPVAHCGEDILLVTDYDRLIEQTEEEVERLTAALAPFLQIGAEQKQQAAARIAPEMRRSAVPTTSANNPLIEQAYDGLAAMARDKKPADSFNRLLASFPEMERLFQPWQDDRRHPLLDWAARLIVRGSYR